MTLFPSRWAVLGNACHSSIQGVDGQVTLGFSVTSRFLVEFNLCSWWHSDLTAKGKQPLALASQLRVMNPGFTGCLSSGSARMKLFRTNWWVWSSVSKGTLCAKCSTIQPDKNSATLIQPMLNMHSDLCPLLRLRGHTLQGDVIRKLLGSAEIWGRQTRCLLRLNGEITALFCFNYLHKIEI